MIQLLIKAAVKLGGTLVFLVIAMGLIAGSITALPQALFTRIQSECFGDGPRKGSKK